MELFLAYHVVLMAIGGLAGGMVFAWGLELRELGITTLGALILALAVGGAAATSETHKYLIGCAKETAKLELSRLGAAIIPPTTATSTIIAVPVLTTTIRPIQMCLTSMFPRRGKLCPASSSTTRQQFVGQINKESRYGNVRLCKCAGDSVPGVR